MGVLVDIWLGLFVFVSISAIIGCNSFVHRASETRSCSSNHRRHAKHFSWNLSTTSILSRSDDTNGDEENRFASPCVDVKGENDIDDATLSCDENEATFGLYIHIPYCRQRCRYCDFAIVPIGDHGRKKIGEGDTFDFETVSDESTNQQSRREQGFRRMDDRYVSAVISELKQIVAARNASTTGQKVPLRSIYFGGGTPSLAPIESIESILYHACGRDNPEASGCRTTSGTP